jgi:hypothetical protein
MKDKLRETPPQPQFPPIGCLQCFKDMKCKETGDPLPCDKYTSPPK